MKQLVTSLRDAIVLFVMTFVYLEVGTGLMHVAEGPWRIPASLVLVFFLPVLVSHAIRVYREFCQLWQHPQDPQAMA